MSQVKLNKTEEKVLVEAAGREDGRLVFPAATKDLTRQRMLGKLEVEGLIIASDEHDGDPVLTREGYRAIGLKPPRRRRLGKAPMDAPVTATEPAETEARTPRRTKQALIVSLLGREGGATLPELIEATGWLPHTTRAALSRLRSAGNALAKARREDGVTAYRVLA